MKLSEAKPIIEALMSDSPIAEITHWLNHAYEGDGDDSYCESCADKAKAALISGLVGEDLPAWDNCTEETLEIYHDYMESDGSRTCDACGKILAVALTDCGVDSELSHFEESGVETALEWRAIAAVIDAIDYVEGARFVALQQPEAVALYDRTVALVEKYLPKLEGKS